MDIEKNLGNEQTLKDTQDRLSELQKSLGSSRKELEDLMAEQDRLLSRYAPSQVLDTLKTGMVSADEASESLARDFLAQRGGTMSVEVFRDTYMPARTTYHRRKAAYAKAKDSPHLLDDLVPQMAATRIE